jgi:hypothetical protein
MSNVTQLQPTPDPFDPANLRLDQSFMDGSGVKKLLTTVPVKKPSKQDFIRVHPDPAYRVSTAIIELRDDRECYLVMPHVAAQIPGEVLPVVIYTAINRQGVVFLWPARIPATDGRVNEWHRSAMEAAERAMTQWLRVSSNMDLGAYEMIEAQATMPDPIWPTESLRDLLKIGFRESLVDDYGHPVLKRLRGES